MGPSFREDDGGRDTRTNALKERVIDTCDRRYIWGDCASEAGAGANPRPGPSYQQMRERSASRHTPLDEKEDMCPVLRLSSRLRQTLSPCRGLSHSSQEWPPDEP